MTRKGNTVGSANIYFGNFYRDRELAYILGLWCADGYHWSSSIGLSSVNSMLIERFRNFLKNLFDEQRIKLKVYYPAKLKKPGFLNPVAKYLPMRKASQNAYQLYVNSRPLLRIIREARLNILDMTDAASISSYFAGRFDGDGSIARDGRRDCRIVYSNQNEAELDRTLLARLKIEAKIYHYKKANTFCLYIPRNQAKEFMKIIEPYQTRSQNIYSHPVETYLA